MTEAALAALPQLLAATAGAGTSLPQTGRAIPLVAAGVAIGVALLLRIGGSRLGGGDPPLSSNGDDPRGAPEIRDPEDP